MRIINKTDINVCLDDLINKKVWEVERGKDFLIPVQLNDLSDWVVIIRYMRKNSKFPFDGYCSPVSKTIMIKINPNNNYPVEVKECIGTEQTLLGYRYITQKVVFNSPNEIIRFVFLHEFSHLLDHYMGYKLSYKQTRANRFALRNLNLLNQNINKT